MLRRRADRIGMSIGTEVRNGGRESVWSGPKLEDGHVRGRVLRVDFPIQTFRHSNRGTILWAMLLGMLGGSALTESAAGGNLDVTGKTDEVVEEAPPPEVGSEVELDQLLVLPSSMSFDNDTRHGANSNEWRSRFRASFKEISAAQEALEATKQELDSQASTGGGSQWQMAPPGANNTEVTPMSFKLREDLRKGRERLAEAEDKHRALIIQADLAGVPDAWRQPD